MDKVIKISKHYLMVQHLKMIKKFILGLKDYQQLKSLLIINLLDHQEIKN